MKKLDKKRRRQNKTNYSKRLILLKSNKPRLVIRKSNKYILAQIVTSKHAQDTVKFSASTKELLKHGWPKEKEGSLKNLAAAYLCGYLLAKKTKDIKDAILDTGLIPNTKGSRLYAVVNGIIEGGINIAHNEKIMLDIEKIKERCSKFDEIKEKIK